MADLVTELVSGDLPERVDLGFGDLVSDAALARARGRGDPLADDVVARLARRHDVSPGEDVLAEVRLLAEVEGGVFRELLEACCYVPAWADFAAMEPGLHLVARAAPLSPPVTHAEPAPRPEPAQELAQRLSATGTDLFLLPLTGEVQPGGRHHTIVTRMRLVHATIRWGLAEGGRDLTRRAVPVNQVHLATALATFAYLSVAGMVRMGVPVTDEEIASTGLLWRWIGHVLGVDDDLMRLDSDGHVDRFRHLMAVEAARADLAADALEVVDEALTALPRPLASVARGAVRRSTAGRGQRRSPARDSDDPWTRRARRAAAPGFGFTLRVPGGATVMQRVGTALIEARYASASAAAYGASGPGGPVDAAGTLRSRHPAAATRH